MSFWNKMLDTMGFREERDDDYYYYDEEIEEEGNLEPEYYEPVKKSSGSRFSRFSFGSSDVTVHEEPVKPKAHIVLMQPIRFEQAQNVVNNLLKGHIVVIDLQSVNVEDALNLVNFVSGAIFAIHGNIQKINDKGAIFLCLPAGVVLDNELSRSLEDTISGPTVADWVNNTKMKNEL